MKKRPIQDQLVIEECVRTCGRADVMFDPDCSHEVTQNVFIPERLVVCQDEARRFVGLYFHGHFWRTSKAKDACRIRLLCEDAIRVAKMITEKCASPMP